MKKTISLLIVLLIAGGYIIGLTGCYYDKEVNICSDTAAAYKNNIKPLVEANCVSCHNSSNPNGSHDYSTFDGLHEVAINGLLVGSVTHAPGFTPMPKNRAQLSECQINQIKKWVNAGAPNN